MVDTSLHGENSKGSRENRKQIHIKAAQAALREGDKESIRLSAKQLGVSIDKRSIDEVKSELREKIRDYKSA